MFRSRPVFDTRTFRPWYFTIVSFLAAFLFGAAAFAGEYFTHFAAVVSAAVLLPAASFQYMVQNRVAGLFVCAASVVFITSIIGMIWNVHPASMVFEISDIFLWGGAIGAACAVPLLFQTRFRQLLLYILITCAPLASVGFVFAEYILQTDVPWISAQLIPQYAGLALILLCIGMLYIPLSWRGRMLVYGIGVIHVGAVCVFAPISVWFVFIFCLVALIGGYEKQKYLRDDEDIVPLVQKRAVYTVLFVAIGALCFNFFVGAPQGVIDDRSVAPVGETFEILAAHYAVDTSRILYGSGPGIFPYVWDQHYTEWTRQSNTDEYVQAPTTALSLLFSNGLLAVAVLFAVFLFSIRLFIETVRTSTRDTVSYLYAVTPRAACVYLFGMLFFTHISPGLIVGLGIFAGLCSMRKPERELNVRKKWLVRMSIKSVLVIFCITGALILGVEYRAEMLVQRGIALREQGAVNAATALFRQSTAIRSRADALRYLSQIEREKLSQTLSEAGSEQAAIRAVREHGSSLIVNARRAVMHNDKSAQNWETLGDGYALLATISITGAAAQGADAYKKALEYRPWDPTLYYRIGMVYANGNDAARAEAAFSHALRLDPAYTEARTALESL